MTGTAMIDPDRRRNRLRPYIWGAAACLLLLPAVAMQLRAPSVHWSASDFIVMGVMLAIACGLYELGAWLSGNLAYRAGFGLAALTGFLTVWVNLAVGMLGSENDIINLMFAGVLLVAALKPRGMARAMIAAAIAQLAAAGAGLAMGGFETRELVLTAMFALPWLVSAALFHQAARQQQRADA